MYSPLVLEVPAQHSQDLPWEAEERCPSPDHKETDPLKCLSQVQNPKPLLPNLLLLLGI